MADGFGERVGVGEVADANAAPGDLVLVGRPDPARRRPDLPFAAPGFAQQVELAVIREDQVRLVADHQAVADGNPCPLELVDLREERLRVDDDAVANHTGDAGVKDAGRQQAKDELASACIDGMPGVVASLVAGDDREIRSQQVDDFALSFVAPLCAEHGDVHKGLIVLNMTARQILFDGSTLTVAGLCEIADGAATVALSPDAATRIDASRAVVDRHATDDRPMYGINTGFGALAETIIPRDALDTLQLNLLRSHAAGVGEPLGVRAVRATMALRANVLAKGFSGIRRRTVEHLLTLLNARVHPVVPSRGSVGASGDLAPLAHISLVLIGEGFATIGDSTVPVPGADALAQAGIEPIRLEAKEGLALINGTQPSAAVAALALADAGRLSRAADIALALSIDALRGSVHPFEARIHDARPHAGQQRSAANVRRLLEGSAINKSHEKCGKVQDAYSLRCAAQVHGAARDALDFVERTLTTEANAATDNPMVFAGDDDDRVGRQFSRRAGLDRRRSPGDRGRAVRHDQRAPVRSARQSRAERARAVPDPEQRAAVGLHDGPGHCRSPGVGDQDPRPPGERGHHPHLRQS